MYIRPNKLEQLVSTLAQYSCAHTTYSAVRGYGRQKGYLEAYQDRGLSVTFLPKTRLDFVVDDKDVESVIDSARTVLHTGRIGDGKILVMACKSHDAKK